VRSVAKFGTVYPSYLFVEHDPVLDAIDTIIADSGKSLTYVATNSGIARTTLDNWRLRKTKRPQFATVAAVIRACGGELTINRETKKQMLNVTGGKK
jgi:DNA-binding phage protein